LTPSGTDWPDIAVAPEHWLTGRAGWFGHVRVAADKSPIGAGIGFGTARLRPGDDGTHHDAAAIVRAGIEAGIQVIDTASNYGNGLAEVAVGTALRTMAAIGAVDRDDIVIVSKAGYLPTEDPRHQGHTIHPAFLCQSIAASRRRMGLATIDAYLLHNPEEQLVSGRSGWTVLPDTFGALERAASEGAIGCYGVSAAEGFLAEEPCFHSLQRLLGIARDVGGPDHHFRVIELPVSLWRREAFMATPYLVEQRPTSTLELAAAEGLRVLASSPLGGRRDRQEATQVLRSMFPDCPIISPAMLALQFTRSVPGIHAALAGVSTPRHVVELRELMSVPRWDLA
jgi:aryl-alcohol dehydrogenase-like predicted oxidoreductase